MSAPRYAFTFYTFISCAPMIFDDCLMIITHLFHEYCLLSMSISHNKSHPTKFFFIANSFAVHIFPLLSRISLVHLIVPPFSSQLSLQFDLLSCSSFLVSGTKPFLTRCYAALIQCVVLHHVLILIEWIPLARLPSEPEYEKAMDVGLVQLEAAAWTTTPANDNQISHVHNAPIGLRSELE